MEENRNIEEYLQEHRQRMEDAFSGTDEAFDRIIEQFEQSGQREALAHRSIQQEMSNVQQLVQRVQQGEQEIQHHLTTRIQELESMEQILQNLGQYEFPRQNQGQQIRALVQSAPVASAPIDNDSDDDRNHRSRRR